ncbi:MAG: hypothetical protein ACLFQK_08795 [Fibrobacterota bacterium]
MKNNHYLCCISVYFLLLFFLSGCTSTGELKKEDKIRTYPGHRKTSTDLREKCPSIDSLVSVIDSVTVINTELRVTVDSLGLINEKLKKDIRELESGFILGKNKKAGKASAVSAMAEAHVYIDATRKAHRNELMKLYRKAEKEFVEKNYSASIYYSSEIIKKASLLPGKNKEITDEFLITENNTPVFSENSENSKIIIRLKFGDSVIFSGKNRSGIFRKCLVPEYNIEGFIKKSALKPVLR